MNNKFKIMLYKYMFKVMQFVNNIRHRMAHYDSRCYIAGKITGLDEFEATGNFMYCAAMIKKKGFIPVVPLGMFPKDWPYFRIMVGCLFELLLCRTIFMQDNWKRSRGSMIELTFAKILRKTVIYETKYTNKN